MGREKGEWWVCCAGGGGRSSDEYVRGRDGGRGEKR